MGKEFEYQSLENTNAMLYAHTDGLCMGEACTLHKRTDHSMRRFPQLWRTDRKIMERICPHSVGHPDPDEYKIIEGLDDGAHDCDGCCIQFATEEDYNDMRKHGE